MKATELRIGNYVFYNSEDDKNRPVRMYNKIDEDDIYQMSKSEKYLNLHEPIPLTANLLSNLLKQVEGYSSVWEVSDWFWIFVNEAGEYELSINSGEYHTGLKSSYLHQLQNLYFALTGEELEVKIEGYEKATS